MENYYSWVKDVVPQLRQACPVSAIEQYNRLLPPPPAQGPMPSQVGKMLLFQPRSQEEKVGKACMGYIENHNMRLKGAGAAISVNHV